MNEKSLHDLYETYLSFQLPDLILSLLCPHNQLEKQNGEYKIQEPVDMQTQLHQISVITDYE